MIKITLSNRLGERRWSQSDLARKTGIRPTTISDLYNELAKSINLTHLDLICDALGCEPTDILTRSTATSTACPVTEGHIENDALKDEIHRGIDDLTTGEAMLLVSFISFLKGNRLPREDMATQAHTATQQPIGIGKADFTKQMEAVSHRLTAQ